MTKANELKPVLIFDNKLNEEQKKSIKFEIYLNGRKGNVLATYWDFVEFIDMYRINPNSIDAALLEAGVETKTPDGVARFVRVSPSDDVVLTMTNIPNLEEFVQGASKNSR